MDMWGAHQMSSLHGSGSTILVPGFDPPPPPAPQLPRSVKARGLQRQRLGGLLRPAAQQGTRVARRARAQRARTKPKPLEETGGCPKKLQGNTGVSSLTVCEGYQRQKKRGPSVSLYPTWVTLTRVKKLRPTPHWKF